LREVDRWAAASFMLTVGASQARLGSEASVKRGMSDAELKAVTAQIKKLTARVEALERLLDRILRQKPVSRETAGEGAEKPCDWSRDGRLVNV
jgi:hypothetical protein